MVFAYGLIAENAFAWLLERTTAKVTLRQSLLCSSSFVVCSVRCLVLSELSGCGDNGETIGETTRKFCFDLYFVVLGCFEAISELLSALSIFGTCFFLLEISRKMLHPDGAMSTYLLDSLMRTALPIFSVSTYPFSSSWCTSLIIFPWPLMLAAWLSWRWLFAVPPSRLIASMTMASSSDSFGGLAMVSMVFV